MVIKSFLYAATFVACVVRSAPVKLQQRQAPSGVPEYVLKYAPIIYLHSEDPYLPTDLQTFLDHTTPEVNFNEVSGPSKPLTLDNVSQMGADVWLTSNDDVTTNPEWIKGTKPDSNGKTNGAVTAAVIVNDKGNGNVDAFYMYFYGFDYGGEVLGWKKLNFGNHVGDWEHTMVRFSNGIPQAIWFSQHGNGQAFQYNVVEKAGDRPVAYSAKGTHANYAMPGTHDHVIPNLNLPFGPLEDDTDKGVMWDPLLSAYHYKFNAGDSSFEAYDKGTPTAWLGYKGAWGDEEYPKSDKRQFKLGDVARYVGGPRGPWDKQLNRDKVCPENGNTCIVRGILVPRSSRTEDVVLEGDEVVL